jgi:hypothetical protein
MTDIADMLSAQLLLQRESFGKDPTKLTPDERAEFIRWNVLALTDELHEALNEVGWKPWATNREIDHEAFMKELVDAWHFFMNLMLAGSGMELTGESSDDLRIETLAQWFGDKYFEKRKVNAKRQADSYTGTDKCPSCKRDRQTTAREIDVTNLDDHEPQVMITCPCGYVYH